VRSHDKIRARPDILREECISQSTNTCISILASSVQLVAIDTP
jgi:hypothetical protein